ncbi:MAG: glycosyltransferase family 4 protein [Campylobacterota bacterium]|nr:glycosyltransferase family 4 protein [Campylobacterota bacterium]
MLNVYIVLFILSFGLTYLVKNYAIKKSLMDIPNDRSSHAAPTPHGGGTAIAVTWFAGIGYLFAVDQISSDLFYALMAGAVIALVSYLDDLYELRPKVRIAAQLFSALAGLWFLGGLNVLDFGLFTIENQIITNTIAVIAIIWFINLYNFLDGIDGYAGSEAVFLGIAGYLLFGEVHFLVFVASVLGFLVWNWHKAKIFMGDAGSTLLGYNIAIFAIYYQNHGTSIIIWLILFALFWFDATFTLYRRYRNREHLLKAHRKHAYQKLTQSGWSHSRVVIYSVIINTTLFILAWLAMNNPSLELVLFLVSILFLYLIARAINIKKALHIDE